MSRFRSGVAGFLAIVLLVVLFQNLGTARIAVLFWSWELPLIVVMAAFAALGTLLGALVALALVPGRGKSPPA
jgi:uncharacterized integral membrane protein